MALGANPGYNTLFLKVPEKKITIVMVENLMQLGTKPSTFVPDLAGEITLDLFDQ